MIIDQIIFVPCSRILKPDLDDSFAQARNVRNPEQCSWTTLMVKNQCNFIVEFGKRCVHKVVSQHFDKFHLSRSWPSGLQSSWKFAWKQKFRCGSCCLFVCLFVFLLFCLFGLPVCLFVFLLFLFVLFVWSGVKIIIIWICLTMYLKNVNLLISESRPIPGGFWLKLIDENLTILWGEGVLFEKWTVGWADKIAPTPVSGWVSQSVIHSFRFGDSYRISELCGLFGK